MNPPTDTSETMVAQRRTVTQNAPCSWMVHHRGLLERHGRTLALGIALRHIRSAPTECRLLAMIEEILVHHVGVEAFAVVDASEEPQLLAARGLAPMDATPPPIARIPLGSGDWMLGALLIFRLIDGKPALDDFDHELLAALGPQIAIALHSARLDTARPTVRPLRTPCPEGP
jgi:GAF domain-containing protein